MFKKIVTLVTILVLLISNILTDSVNAGSNDGYFIVTAYYSPLPNQTKYIMGNYEAEVRMNGQGYRGAGGKRVFSSMLAAPGIYSFGTKIYLEGLGIGEVADRGGAIVKSGQRNFGHDRIDLWVGHGEEGLRRAMYWGKRTIKGKVIKRGNKATVDIKKIPAPKWATAYLHNNRTFIKKIIKQKNKKYPFFNYGIGTKSKKESIIVLQEFLKKINLYNGKSHGIYSSQLMNNIYNFQRKNNLVKNWSDVNAGYWSKKTRNLIWKKYESGEFKKKEKSIKLTRTKLKQEKVSLASKKQNTIIQFYSQTQGLEDIFSKKIENVRGVKRLQRILKKLGFYNGEINGEYSDTRNSIFNFQIENKIVTNKKSIGAGNYGPTTRKILKKAYSNYGINKSKNKILKQKKAIISTKELASARARVNNLGNIKSGDISHQVREFQKILSTLGFFKQKDTAIFGSKTTYALIQYQLDRKIITDSKIHGAGLIGPKTKKQLIKDLSEL